MPPPTGITSLCKAVTLYRGIGLPALNRPTVKALALARPTNRSLMIIPKALPPMLRTDPPLALMLRPPPGTLSLIKNSPKSLVEWKPIETSLTNYSGKATELQPIEYEIKNEPRKEQGPRGCVLAFIADLLKVGYKIHERGQERKNKSVEPEEEDLITDADVAHSAGDLRKAAENYEKCLAKNQSLSKDIQDYLLREAKDQIKNIIKKAIKEAFKNYEKDIEAFKQKLIKYIESYYKKIDEAEKKAMSEVKALASDIETFNRELAKSDNAIRKAQINISQAYVVATKDYTDIVKKTAGLTSVRPSVTKNLEKYRDTGDRKYLRDAGKALRAHLTQVLSENDRNQPKVKKFRVSMEAMIDQCG